MSSFPLKLHVYTYQILARFSPSDHHTPRLSTCLPILYVTKRSITLTHGLHKSILDRVTHYIQEVWQPKLNFQEACSVGIFCLNYSLLLSSLQIKGTTAPKISNTTQILHSTFYLQLVWL